MTTDRVWIVVDDVPYEFTNILAVFSTKKGAHQYKESLTQKKVQGDLYVWDYKVDFRDPLIDPTPSVNPEQ